MGRKKKTEKQETSQEKETKKTDSISEFDLVTAELENMHGTSFFAKEKEEHGWLKTGSLTFDFGLDPLGRGLRDAVAFSFSSEPKVGKTRTLMYLAGKAQKEKFTDFVLYCDVECRATIETCQELGIDTSKEKFQMIKPDCAEQIFDSVERFLSTGKRIFIILDSIDALMSSKIKSLGWFDEGDMKSRNTSGLRRAGLVTEFINATNSKVRKTHSVFAYTQQMRTKMGPAFSYRGESGASSVSYNADYKIRILPCKKPEIIFSQDINGQKQSVTVGRMLNFEFVLNAFNAPGIEEKVALLYTRGLWEEYDIANLGVKFGFITKEKGKVTKEGEDDSGKVTYVSADGKEIVKKNIQSFAAFLTNKDKIPEINEIKKELRKKIVDALEQKSLIKAL